MLHGGATRFVSATNLILLALSGCARTDSAEAKFNLAQAEVEKALDAWTRGEPSSQFEEFDPDWKAGYRLKSFLVADTKTVEGATDQVRCRVSMALADTKGKQIEKDVAYIVQLGGKSTIRREARK